MTPRFRRAARLCVLLWAPLVGAQAFATPGAEAIAGEVEASERSSSTGLTPTEVTAAPVAPVPVTPAAEPPGAFLGEDLRYPNANVFQRYGADLLAIPLGLARWDASDWAWFGATVGVTAALFFPLDAPIDQRFQNYLRDEFPSLRPGLWSPHNDLYIFGGLLALAAGSLGYGHWMREDAFIETFSLLAEALAVVQTFHITSKLLLSRDGPRSGNGRTIHGPTAGTFERFPEGAPSGHTGTLFALATVVSIYWEKPWLSVLVYATAAAFASALVLDQYHYISDVLVGGSLGVAVGRYIVHHRSSRFRYQGAEAVRRERLEVTPLVAPTPSGPAAGAAIRGDF